MSLWLPAQAQRADAGPPASESALPILFLDRDGVIITERHYLRDPAAAELISGAGDALLRARERGFRLVGVSNQSGIGRGLYSEEDFRAVQQRVDELLAAAGVWLDALYYCPHAPEEKCACRKPAPGLLQEAATRFEWSTENSWLVGDKAADMEMALAADLGAIMVETGYGREQKLRLNEPARVTIVPDLSAAVAHILGGGQA
jgi:histidinol-phosphate phosphatase family protein